jgi:hypothetical protein
MPITYSAAVGVSSPAERVGPDRQVAASGGMSVRDGDVSPSGVRNILSSSVR